MGYREKNNTLDHSVVYAYNAENLIESITETVNGVSKTYTYTYNEYDRLISETVDGTTVTYTYDEFGRLSNQVTKQGDTTVLSEPYVYVSPKSGVTSTQVYRYRTTTATGNSTWYYTYDQNGNITYVDSSAFGDVSYQYDSQGQLLWEYSNVTYYATQWEYDDAGNILSRKVYDYYFDEIDSLHRSDTYSYTDTQWGDLLTGYNGRTITYDGIGNPVNDGIWTYAWQHGRQLASMTQGGTTWTYTYNSDGLRTKKTDGTNTYTYIYNGSKLTAMTKGSDTLYFTYDAVGTPLTVTYNGTVYYYGTNLQGDIAEIYNAAGTMVVGYRYNAYGELDSMFGSMADTLGILNPLRYRGYVYDTETELYYLQSRYYNPEWGRFINADVYATTGQGFIGNNMFAYCGNNPVHRTDSSGNFWDLAFDLFSLGSSIVDVIRNPTDPGAWLGLAGDVLDVAVPGLSGVGEVVDAVNISRKTVKAVDNAYDTLKVVDNTVDMADDIHDAQKAYDTVSEGLCFVAGTLVHTAEDYIAIEDIEEGQYVWAWDEETNTVGLKEVVETYVNETTELIHVFVGGEEIITTPSHPFYSPVKGWTDAVHLRAGDILVTVNGELVIVEKIQHEILESPIKVYNFQVERYHTYYVGTSGILVHNKCVVNEKGVKVEVRTSNEHGLPHAHVSGNGPNTTVGLDLNPMKNHKPFSSKQWKVIQANWETIINGIKKFFPK